MKHTQRKDVGGVRIRRQYFNYPICIFLSVWLICVEVGTCLYLVEHSFHFDQWRENMLDLTFIVAKFIAPFLVLSVLNRFFFGKIVCVLNEEGIRYKNGIIKWYDIVSIKYHIMDLNKFHYRPSYIDVVCKNKTVQIKSAPLYMFSFVKKSNADIEIKTDITVWGILALHILAPIIITLYRSLS